MDDSRILIVEDEMVVANGLKDLLLGLGYRFCEVASSAEQALQFAQEQRPDLAFIDINLPGIMDGIDAANYLRSLYSVPVIYLTAFSDKATLQHAKETEPYGYLLKPFEAASLQIAIEMALHKHAIEKKLRESEGRYRSLVENSHAGILIIDQAYHITYANNRLGQILGYRNDELIGQDFRKFLDPQTADQLASRYRSRQRGQPEPDIYEFTLTRQDGTTQCVEISAALIEDPDGNISTVGQLLDITERKKSEAEIAEYQKSLETMVEEQTADLAQANRQLKHEVLERGRAEETLRQYSDDLRILNDLSLKVSASLSLDNFLQAAVEGVVDCTTPDLVMLHLNQGGYLHLAGAYPPAIMESGEHKFHSIGNCLCGLAASEGAPLYSRDIAKDPLCTIDECKHAGIHPFAALPLISAGNVLGVLGIASFSERDFSTQANFLEALTNVVAIALQNTLLHKNLEDRALDLEEEITRRERSEAELKNHRDHLEVLVAERTTNLTITNQALLESENIFRSVVEESLDGITLADEHGKIIEWNSTMEQITGLGKDEALGRSIWDVQFEMLPQDQRKPEYRDELANSIQEALSSGQALWFGQPVENAILRPDSVGRIVQNSTFSIKTDKGYMLSSIARDVTEPELAKRTLQESERRMREMLESVQLASVMLDIQGNITFCNNYLLEMTGWDRPDVLGKNWFEHFVRPENDVEQIFMDAIAQETIPSQIEYPMLTREGKERLIVWSNTLLRAPQGNVIGLSSLGLDITERVEIEQELSQYREQLEKLVFERTAELDVSRQELAAQVTALNTIHQVGVALSLKLDPSKMLNFIAEQAVAILNAPNCSIFIYDEETEELVCQASVHNIVGARVPVTKGIVGRAFRESKTQVVEDANKDPDNYPVSDEIDYMLRSMLACPMFVESHPIGILALSSDQQAYFNERDQALMETLASHAAISIQNATLYEHAQQEISERKHVQADLIESKAHLEASRQALADRVAELDGLHHIGMAVSSELKTDALLKLIVDQAASLVNTASCSIWLLDKDSGEMVCHAAVDDIVGVRVTPGQGILARALQEGVPQLVNHVSDDQDHYASVGHESGLLTKSVIAIPLSLDQQVDGVLEAVNKQENQFDEHDQELLMTLANQAAIAIKNATLFEKAQDEIARREIIEDELRQHRDRLDDLVQQRTAELSAANLALQESEARYRNLFETSPDGISLIDLQGNLLFCNQVLAEMHGYNHPNEMVGINALQLIAPESLQSALDAFEDAADSSQKSFRGTVVRQDGSQFLADIRTSMVLDEAGQPNAIMGITRDITEQMRAQDQRRLQAVALQSAANAIVITDRDGSMIWANPAFTDLTGYELDEVIGENPRLLKSGSHPDSYYQDLWDTVLAGEVWRNEIVNRRKDGSHYIEDLTITPVIDATGEITHFVEVKQDISKRKHSEDILRLNELRLNALLELSQSAGEMSEAEITQLALEQAVRLTDSQIGYLHFVKPDQQTIQLSTWTEATQEYCDAVYDDHYPLNEAGVWADCARTKEPVVHNDYQNLAAKKGLPEGHHTVIRHLSVPVIDEDQVTMIMGMGNKSKHYTADDIRQTRLMADSLWQIIRRKRAEQALTQSENRYRQVVELAPMMIAVQSDNQIEFINDVGLQLLGLESLDQAMGKPLIDFIDPHHRQDFWDRYSQLILGDQPAQFIEDTLVLSNGAQLDVEVSIKLTGEAEKQVLQIVARDITERKEHQQFLHRQAALAELELTASKSGELQPLLDRLVQIATEQLSAGLGCIVLVTDAQNNAYWVGASSLERSVENAFRQYSQSPEDVARWFIEKQRALIVSDVGSDQDENGLLLCEAGVGCYIAAPLQFEQQIFGVLYALDKRAHHFRPQDMDFILSLAGRAAIAVAKVRLYESLERARDSAEDAARTQSEFLANMSHELRTPLTAVISLAELLNETALDKDQLEYVHTITTSTQKLMTLINNVLDFSKIEARKLSISEAPFDLRACIEVSLDMISTEADKKDLVLIYRVEPNIPARIVGDELRVSQVLTNLLSNAVKFTSEGEVSLTVTISQKDHLNDPSLGGPLSELLFTVRDTGIGIPPEQIEDLFGAFRQLDASTTRKYGGTGLGLAISRQLVEMMGGRIWAESSGVDFEGSSFYFTLPVESVKESAAGSLQRPQPWLAGKRALILGGNTTIIEILDDHLTHWGMSTYSFGTAGEALDWFQPDMPVDLVLLIILEPSIGASALVSQLYQSMQPNQPPLIVCSNASDPIDEPSTIPIADHLGFPIKPSQLFETLAAIYGDTIKYPVDQGPAIAQIETQSMKILVADDDPVNQKVIRLRLERMGHQVSVAANGLLAIKALEQGAYDIVLMDLQMPEMDGLAATGYIRTAFPRNQQPYIIALTADARPEARENLEMAGVDYFLTKPVRGKALSQALAQLDDKNLSDRPPLAKPGAVDLSQTVKSTFDRSVFADLVTSIGDQGLDVIVDLLDQFFQIAPNLVEDMKRAVVQKDWKKLRFTAHTLKGNCELLGAARLAELCKELQESVDYNAIEDPDHRVTQIEVELKQAILAIQSELASLNRKK